MLAPLAGFHSTHQAGSAGSENDDVVFLIHAGMSLAGLPSHRRYGNHRHLDQRRPGFADWEFSDCEFNDCRNVTICQRCCSGSFDQTGMPRRTTPLVSIQNSVPDVACCTSSRSKPGPFLVPPAFLP